MLVAGDNIELSVASPSQFAVIFERHSRAVHRYLARSVSRSTADDLLAEVFVTAFSARNRYDPSYSDARPWLLGIATNTIRRYGRSQRRHSAMLTRLANRTSTEIEISEFEPGDAGEADEIWSALSGVDQRLREAMLLYAAGLTYEEIARALEIPVGTVRSRLSRGRQQFRRLLGQRRGSDVDTADGRSIKKEIRG